ncbi:hypothetical protein JHK86_036844 [Glycine max]|nr:hypothetical protein JHK86_036844 [Glycine max]
MVRWWFDVGFGVGALVGAGASARLARKVLGQKRQRRWALRGVMKDKSPDIHVKPENLAPRVGAKQALDLKALRFPLTLNSIERTTVNMPKVESRNEELMEELLLIDVEYDRSEDVRFDVYINDKGDDDIGSEHSKFTGSFVTLPHSSHVHQNNMILVLKTTIVTDLLKELEVKDDDSTIAVTLVPKYGNKPVTV